MSLYPVATHATMYLGHEVTNRRTRDLSTLARGDAVVTNVLSLDDDGRPKGNRRERRMAARELRRRR